VDPTTEITPDEVERWLGIRLEADVIAELLERLEFQVQGSWVMSSGPGLLTTAWISARASQEPRMLMEEIARIYGYERIPEIRMADLLPPQLGNPSLEREERMRDTLVSLGLQEVVTYRMTSPGARSAPAPERYATTGASILRQAGQPVSKRPECAPPKPGQQRAGDPVERNCAPA
jgi:phenylalanyl-tRNA synthetase beta chain